MRSLQQAQFFFFGDAFTLSGSFFSSVAGVCVSPCVVSVVSCALVMSVVLYRGSASVAYPMPIIHKAKTARLQTL